MKIDVTLEEISVVHVGGDVDYAETDQLREMLDSASDDVPPKLIVDLSDVEYMDSAGVQILIVIFKKIRDRSGVLALVAPNDPVRKLLKILGISEIPDLIIANDIDEAKRRIEGQHALEPG